MSSVDSGQFSRLEPQWDPLGASDGGPLPGLAWGSSGPTAAPGPAPPAAPAASAPAPALPALSGGRAPPLSGLLRLFPLCLAAGAPCRPAAPPGTGREALRLRAVRSELPLQIRLCQTPRTKPPRETPSRQTLHLRRLRYAIQISQVF